MASPSFLTDFLLLLVITTGVAILFKQMRLPPLLGYLLGGVAAGPYIFGWLTDSEQIHHLAEIGVVLLMLTIGIEMSFDRFRGVRNLALVGGSLQILISIAVGLGMAAWLDWPLIQGVFLGSFIALSSTAIVLKFLIDRGELETQYGRIALAILLFQDISIAPLMIITQSMGTTDVSIWHTLGISLLKAILLLGGLALFARYVLPSFLKWIALTRSQEILFLSSVVICLGAAWGSGELGLSFGIGAFFAGLMFANTDYGHHFMSQLLPFRHIFVSIFFVSIGLLFDPWFAIQNIWLIMRLVGLVLVINFVVTTLLIMGFGYSPRIAMATGLILSQIGEFSFLLLETARSNGAVDPFFYQTLLSTAFITMLFTPAFFYFLPRLLRFSESQKLLGAPPHLRKLGQEPSSLNNHIIICGFGPTGRELAITCQAENIPFIIIDMSPRQLRDARQAGYQAMYGDAANMETMRQAGIEHARAVVISFRDIIGMEQIVRVSQRLNSKAMLVVRSPFERDVARLYELGADIVIIEEWEASLELHRVVLRQLGLPTEKIDAHLSRITQRKELIIEEAILNQIKTDNNP